MPEVLQRLIPSRLPIYQAPMAGVSTPALAVAVSNAGGLGALGLGASSVAESARAITDVMSATTKPLNANFFCHQQAPADPARDSDWIAAATPLFRSFGVEPPTKLSEIYPPFGDAHVSMLLELCPAVVSFHFGLPRADQLAALRDAGLVLMASATSLAEAEAIQAAGLDAIIAQGWEAGGHRGMFDPEAPDDRLATLDLTRQIRAQLRLPVIAAGGLMDGADIRRALSCGASAAMMGTAFIGCTESAADAAYRARLDLAGETVMTRAVSGRPARSLTNGFTDWAGGVAQVPAPYPRAYDLGKALNSAARARGDTRFSAQWAGAQVARARFLPAAQLMAELEAEYLAA